MTLPRTVVTGAAGFAGSHLIDCLHGAAVIHGWHVPGTRTSDSVQDVTWHPVDITDRDAVFHAVEGIRPDRLYHLAGAPSVETSFRNAVPHLRINALGTAYLLDAVRTFAPRCRVLVITSAQVYASPDGAITESTPLVPNTPYGLTKLAEDLLADDAARAGLDAIVARPFNHIGPRQAPGFAIPSFARQIARIEQGLDAPVLRVGNLDARRDFTDVRDTVAAYRLLMERGHRGQAYNVCSGSPQRIGDLLDALVAMASVPVSITTDPARLRPADVPLIVGDSSRLRHDTGWTTRFDIKTTIADTLDWWRRETRTHAV